ncbi:MAG: metallophosphoesterase [Nitrososphaeria archaeon]
MISLTKRIKIVDPWPALLLDDSTMVVADLHFGIEDELESLGIHIPTSVAHRIMNTILTPLKKLGLNKLIVLGDIKHEFGYPSPSEWLSTKAFIKTLKELKVDLKVVQGNHDNYIIAVLKEFNIELHKKAMHFGSATLTHGHLPLEEIELISEYVILGHEHPSIVITDSVGFKHRFKCFLHGRVGGQTLIVLPSISPIAYGTDVNTNPSSMFLSPFLKDKDVLNMIPYAVEPGKGLQKFPKLKNVC